MGSEMCIRDRIAIAQVNFDPPRRKTAAAGSSLPTPRSLSAPKLTCPRLGIPYRQPIPTSGYGKAFSEPRDYFTLKIDAVS